MAEERVCATLVHFVIVAPGQLAADHARVVAIVRAYREQWIHIHCTIQVPMRVPPGYLRPPTQHLLDQTSPADVQQLLWYMFTMYKLYELHVTTGRALVQPRNSVHSYTLFDTRVPTPPVKQTPKPAPKTKRGRRRGRPLAIKVIQ